MVAGFKCSDTFFNFGHSLVEITSRCPHHDEHAGSVIAPEFGTDTEDGDTLCAFKSSYQFLRQVFHGKSP